MSKKIVRGIRWPFIKKSLVKHTAVVTIAIYARFYTVNDLSFKTLWLFHSYIYIRQLNYEIYLERLYRFWVG